LCTCKCVICKKHNNESNKGRQQYSSSVAGIGWDAERRAWQMVQFGPKAEFMSDWAIHVKVRHLHRSQQGE
jgi:hypothetical protein